MQTVLKQRRSFPTSTVASEIGELEERLRLAEMGPDPQFFERVLDDNLVIVSENGQSFLAKSKIVQAHQPGKGPKFTHENYRSWLQPW